MVVAQAQVAVTKHGRRVPLLPPVSPPSPPTAIRRGGGGGGGGRDFTEVAVPPSSPRGHPDHDGDRRPRAVPVPSIGTAWAECKVACGRLNTALRAPWPARHSPRGLALTVVLLVGVACIAAAAGYAFWHHTGPVAPAHMHLLYAELIPELNAIAAQHPGSAWWLLEGSLIGSLRWVRFVCVGVWVRFVCVVVWVGCHSVDGVGVVV